VIAAARSKAKLASLQADAPESIETLVVDLSLMREVKAATGELIERLERVDVLVNYVGVLLNSFAATDEGFEVSFATNLLNHYLLTELLVESDLLRSGGFVINISSGGMYTAPLAPNLLHVTDPKSHDGVTAYARHKRAQVELTHHWNAKYGPEINFHTMHPGWGRHGGCEDLVARISAVVRATSPHTGTGRGHRHLACCRASRSARRRHLARPRVGARTPHRRHPDGFEAEKAAGGRSGVLDPRELVRTASQSPASRPDSPNPALRAFAPGI
jgi:NAD(P)-dependent dehydrogenase (short-subunit alcohol dehydrogenase family)